MKSVTVTILVPITMGFEVEDDATDEARLFEAACAYAQDAASEGELAIVWDDPATSGITLSEAIVWPE